MAYGSARAFASAFRAIGLEAEPTPPSDNRTRELGARYTSGDECYPAKVTVGDFMKVVENPAIDNQRITAVKIRVQESEDSDDTCRLTVQSGDGKFEFVIPEYEQASELLKKVYGDRADVPGGSSKGFRVKLF